MGRSKVGQVESTGLVRDFSDYRGVQRELERGALVVKPVPAFIERAPMTVELLAGFAWLYLRARYDRFTPYTRPDGSQGWGPFHWDLWTLVCSPDPLVAAAAPRYHAKSTNVTLVYGLANILYRCTDYLVVVSDTFEGQAVEHIREYARELTENEEIQRDFRIKKLVKNVEGDIIIKFEDGTLARIKGLGMEGAIRGLKWRGKRPGMFLLDDIENPELVESKLRRDKSRGWIQKDLLPAGRKGCKTRAVGTILHHDAFLARICKPDSGWKYKVYKAHKSFNDFSEILWPEMWTEAALRAERQRFMAQNESDGYSQEYLNDPTGPIDAFFRMEDLLECDGSDLKSHGDFYAGWDFAVSKEERADFTACSIWKVLPDRRKIKVAQYRDRLDAKQIVDLILQVEADFEPKVQFFEKGTIEKGIEPFLEDRMRATETNVNVMKITRNKDKETFAKPLQGLVRRHDLTFDKSIPLWAFVEEEYLRFPRAPHDDIIDSDSIIAQGLREIVQAPTEAEIDDEDYFNRMRAPRDPFDDVGRNPTTGY